MPCLWEYIMKKVNFIWILTLPVIVWAILIKLFYSWHVNGLCSYNWPLNNTFWTIWIHLYADFFFFPSATHHYVYQWWLAKYTDRVSLVDKEGGLWDFSICRFCYFQWMLEPIPHKYLGQLCYLFSRGIMWVMWINTCKVPGKL